MADRQIVVVDTETTGLKSYHVPIEVAWWNLNTDERGQFFVNWWNWEYAIADADPKALELNGFWQRVQPWIHANGEIERVEQTQKGWLELQRVLEGNTLAGSNPAFDAGHMVRTYFDEPVWHHRMLDLANYAAGRLNKSGDELPGLSAVCDMLGVPAGDHTAEADVTATGLCFRKLFDMHITEYI